MGCLLKVLASTTANTQKKPCESTHSGKGEKTPQLINSPSATTTFPFHRVTRWMHQACWNSSPGTTRNLDHGLTAGTKASNCKSPPLQMWNITISYTLLELPKHLLLASLSKQCTPNMDFSKSSHTALCPWAQLYHGSGVCSDTWLGTCAALWNTLHSGSLHKPAQLNELKHHNPSTLHFILHMFWHYLISTSHPANTYEIYYINGINAQLQFICNISDKFGVSSLSYHMSFQTKRVRKSKDFLDLENRQYV